MIGRLFAGLVVVACVVMLVRLFLPTRRRQRFDGATRRGWARLRRSAAGLRRSTRRLWTWRSSRRRAEQVAEEAIRRARGDAVARDGNVYKPKFRGPRKPH